ncbi:single-stranded DNA-binding protein [Leuconostoc mesenteroides]|jgi:single-strand DNA-binding protein|uniref:single-stranded DNA-binding protein n=1 Tax=Leuconostoc mesenteroides TaxID=1245 RepID=UPI00235DCEAC|nr:single-stranded DNA-binding protein [Leuconostoc mesenteroides]MCH3951983.1 single-stranded DNA-binding protein [Leuconostoc mesenteroides]
MNQVNLTGRLTKDVEVRYTQSGKAVGSGTIAVTRRFKNADGNTDSDFIQYVVWGKSAEILSQYTSKGTLVALTGSWQTRSYEKDDGTRVYVNELNVENFDFLEKKSDSQQSAPKSQAPDPFANQGNKPNELDISDDDLPF